MSYSLFKADMGRSLSSFGRYATQADDVDKVAVVICFGGGECLRAAKAWVSIVAESTAGWRGYNKMFVPCVWSERKFP